MDREYSMSIEKQCRILGISRGAYYYKPHSKSEEQDLMDLKFILDVLRRIPFYGYRKVSKELKKDHQHLTWKRVRRIMRRFGLRALYAKPWLSIPRKEHKKYPYLLRGKTIRFPNQVWATDITYIRLPGGHVYLTAIVDLFSRRVLSWRLSNSMDSAFCVAALEEAIEKFGIPAIFNTDQGSQFTSDAFIDVLKKNNIEISMDGKGRALDNIYVERLWRSLKYEDIYLKSYGSMIELQQGVKQYFEFYNNERFHQALEYSTPVEIYESVFQTEKMKKAS